MYYIDSTSFSTATAVYTDQLLTIKAPDGYYKLGSGYREQLGGVLLNSIQCTTCIDCKQLMSISVKTGSAFDVTYTDCWGYNHTLHFDVDPTYAQGQVRTIDFTDLSLCVKNNSVNSSLAYFSPVYHNSDNCSILTGLIQSQLCNVGGIGSSTPTGCEIDCDAVESSIYVFIDSSISGYLENDMIVYNSNNITDYFVGADLYYKINYNNVVYGVRINNVGKISELTYCNP